MRKKKTITICSSASFFKQALEIKKELEKLGFKVKVPKIAYVMKKTGNFDDNFYRTWNKNKENYRVKTSLIKAHFKKVVECDSILVLNYEKNGVVGYIGGNTLIEMAIAFHYKKPIYIFNEIAESLIFKEEIFGLNPVFINGDLKKLK